MSRISVIIPVYNEENTITDSLSALINNSSPKNISEIILVDGGSSDSTKKSITTFIKAYNAEGEIISLSKSGSFPSKSSYLSKQAIYKKGRFPIKLLESQKGRAIQMNKGASIATSNVLYFLHADTLPPKQYDQLILNTIKKGEFAGCFRLKFDSKHPLLKFSQWFTRFNWKICRGGDQSLFVTRTVFKTLKGFNEDYTIYEDCEFINRLYDTIGFAVLPDYVVTSARKYQKNGTVRLQFHFLIIHIKKRLGASPGKLYDYYKKYIPV